MERIKIWWSLRRYRRVKKDLLKMSLNTQLRFAQSIMIACAVPLPRDERRKFLAGQLKKIEKITKEMIPTNR